MCSHNKTCHLQQVTADLLSHRGSSAGVCGVCGNQTGQQQQDAVVTEVTAEVAVGSGAGRTDETLPVGYWAMAVSE